MKVSNYLAMLVLLPMFSYTQSVKQIKKDALEARDTKDEFFIEMVSGKKIKYNFLKLKTPLGGGNYLVDDKGKVDISWDSIKAFQTEDFYAECFRGKKNITTNGSNNSTVIAQRLRNGKIELFTYSIYSLSTYGANNGGHSREYIVRKGKGGEEFLLTEGILKLLISDNKDLAEEFDKLYKKSNVYKSVTKIIDEYN